MKKRGKHFKASISRGRDPVSLERMRFIRCTAKCATSTFESEEPGNSIRIESQTYLRRTDEGCTSSTIRSTERDTGR